MEIVRSVIRLGLVPLVLCASAAAAESIHERARAAPPDEAAWHISNLYDCRSRSLYIPYHLWTGMAW